MTDLQNKSDWLAEHLLGWERVEKVKSDGISWSMDEYGGAWLLEPPSPMKPKDKFLACAKWQPHEKIEQCFAYIIPAMQSRGFSFDLFIFSQPDNLLDNIGNCSFRPYPCVTFKTLAGMPAAIVEAAYAALQKEKE